ncbi:hypothetical protein PagCFBP13532_22570 [Pantoea agglomerans]|nr:hypothetical protein PagCFBP13505_20425 [Pantoea agglomerans]TKK14548.1 hypothetical protein PagCFBP13516_21595 [Pantoea agglomerans]TKK26151.1 hypothetical protein PagCFBP13532_22570 [Pantoea agglomerans]
MSLDILAQGGRFPENYRKSLACSNAQPAPECRDSGMEAPETVKGGSDAIGRRKPGRAGYRADGGKTLTPSCQTPFKQRPVSSLSAGRSQTKDRISGTTYSNEELTSYNTH